MRDRTKETAETIEQTRLDMAGVEGSLVHIERLANRNMGAAKTFESRTRDSDMEDIKRIVTEQRTILTALRKGLNKTRFDDTFSPLGFELGKDA